MLGGTVFAGAFNRWASLGRSTGIHRWQSPKTTSSILAIPILKAAQWKSWSVAPVRKHANKVYLEPGQVPATADASRKHYIHSGNSRTIWRIGARRLTNRPVAIRLPEHHCNSDHRYHASTRFLWLCTHCSSSALGTLDSTKSERHIASWPAWFWRLYFDTAPRFGKRCS